MSLNPDAWEGLSIDYWYDREKHLCHNAISEPDSTIIVTENSGDGCVKFESKDQKLGKLPYFIAQSDFPNVLKRMTASSAFKYAIKVCEREGWPFEENYINAALNNLEMEYGYLRD